MQMKTESDTARNRQRKIEREREIAKPKHAKTLTHPCMDNHTIHIPQLSVFSLSDSAHILRGTALHLHICLLNMAFVYIYICIHVW